MKHTLKSLLITSVLTLPTVLGSDDDSENPRSAASYTQVDIEAITNFVNRSRIIPENQKNAILNCISQNATVRDILLAADCLRDPKYLGNAISLYVKVSARNDATVEEVLWAAARLRDLGETLENCHEKAAELYKKAADHNDATAEHILKAGDEVRALGDLYQKDSNERKTYHEEAAKLYVKAGTRVDATIWDILWAADGLRALGWTLKDCHKKAADLYKRAADHISTIEPLVRRSANGLREIGNRYQKDSNERNAYHDMATELYVKANLLKFNSCEKILNRPDAEVRDIQRAAADLRELGDQYPEGSLERKLYHEKAANAFARAELLKQRNY